MDSVLIKDLMLKKLQEQNYEGIKGSRLSVHLPVEENLLNFILQTLISTSEGLKDFESIVLSDLQNKEFMVYVNHKKLEKTIRCKLHDVTYREDSDAVLTIEFLEGIGFFEKVALKSMLAFKKGWSWFKSKMQNETGETEAALPTVDFSSSRLTINLSQLLRQQDLHYLNPLINWEEISTRDNKLIVNINIKI